MDEASHWDQLHTGWDVDRINHSLAYSDHGEHTNWVESCFARLRRMMKASTTTSTRAISISMPTTRHG